MSVKHVFFCLRAKNAFLCTGVPFPERSKSACVAFLNYKRFSIKWQSKRANCIARQRNRCSQSRKGKANKKHPHVVCQTRYLRSQFFHVNRLIIEIQKNAIIATIPPTRQCILCLNWGQIALRVSQMDFTRFTLAH
jgi:hypothetical protein